MAFWIIEPLGFFICYLKPPLLIIGNYTFPIINSVSFTVFKRDRSQFSAQIRDIAHLQPTVYNLTLSLALNIYIFLTVSVYSLFTCTKIVILRSLKQYIYQHLKNELYSFISILHCFRRRKSHILDFKYSFLWPQRVKSI